MKHASTTIALTFGWFVKHFVSKVTDHVALPDICVDIC